MKHKPPSVRPTKSSMVAVSRSTSPGVVVVVVAEDMAAAAAAADMEAAAADMAVVAADTEANPTTAPVVTASKMTMVLNSEVIMVLLHSVALPNIDIQYALQLAHYTL